MSNELARAGDLLESAASETAEEEASNRLTDLSEQLTSLASDGRGADHGRLARFQAALDEIQPTVDDDTAATIEQARDELSAYRETISGV